MQVRAVSSVAQASWRLPKHITNATHVQGMWDSGEKAGTKTQYGVQKAKFFSDGQVAKVFIFF